MPVEGELEPRVPHPLASALHRGPVVELGGQALGVTEEHPDPEVTREGLGGDHGSPVVGL